MNRKVKKGVAFCIYIAIVISLNVVKKSGSPSHKTDVIDKELASEPGVPSTPVNPVVHTSKDDYASFEASESRPVFLAGGLPSRDGTSPQRMELALPNGESMGITFDEFSISSSGAINWTGRIDGEPESFFSLSMVGDAVEGHTLSERGEFELIGNQSGELTLTEIHLPPGFCGTCQAVHHRAAGYGDEYIELQSDEPIVLAAGDPVVDVLVVYTPLALQDAGSLEALLAKANQMINSLNNIISSSDAGAAVNLIGIAPVSHAAASATSDGSCSTLWSRLKDPSDGQLDEAHGYREAYGADMVCVFGKATGYGIASIGGAWSAADYSTAHGVMPHELGHNLGCGHNDVSGSGQTYLQGVFTYSFGHYFDYDGEQRGTIMSYVGRRMTRFSNPNKTWNGVITGTATRDHARTVRVFAPTAAAWKTLADPNDYDQDGIPNSQESGSADADGDGLPDLLDPDIVDPEGEPSTGLVAYWPLDEGSGTETANAAGTSYTATLENGATWGSDATRDSYVSFDGTDDRIATTFKYALADTNDFTWAWWANKQTPAGTDSGAIMVGSRYGNTGLENYEFIKFTPVSVQFANTSNTGEIERYDYADISDLDWHHYAMVKSGTNYQWYVDGVAQGVASNFNYNETSRIPFLIGGDGDNKPNEHFEGYIDDVVLYREALTPAEIVDVKNGMIPPSGPTGLAVTAGVGSVSLDWTDNGESDLASYNVYRSTTSGSYGAALINGVATSDYVDNTAINGTTYYYVVTAVDTSSNESGNSNEDSATPQTALNPIIHSYSAAQTPNIPENLLDGDTTDASRWSAQIFPHWVVIDYGTEILIEGARVWTYLDRAYQFTIEASDSPTTGYTTIVDRTTNTSGTQPISDDFGAVSARYLRFTVTGASGYAGDWASITEVDIVRGGIPPITESPVLDLDINGADMVFNWTASGFKVQSRTNLTEGSWFDVPGGDVPPVNVIPIDSEGFYRLIDQ